MIKAPQPLSSPKVVINSAWFKNYSLQFAPGDDGMVCVSTVIKDPGQATMTHSDMFKLDDFEIWCVEACRLCQSQREAEKQQ